jgi:hypothetical protein
MWLERAGWSKLMYISGYGSKSEMESDAAKLDSTSRAWKNAEKELHVLETYTLVKMETDLTAKKLEADLAMKRTETQAAAKVDQAKLDVHVKQKVYDQEKAKRIDIELQIERCIIRAPTDGLCIYYVSPQSRWGRGNQSIIAQGEPVEYNNKLMQIPDLSNMIVRARIPQAQVKYLRSEDPNYPEKAQKALITVDGYGDRAMKGHVKTVATIASQQDFLSGDVKVYETEVTIDEPVKDLKPGMAAKVTIVAYQSPKPVVTVPIQAVVGTVTMGKDRKVFVIDENGNAELRDIKIGRNNERVVEVLDGLKKGEKVALDPSLLITGDSGLRPTKLGGGGGAEGFGGEGKGGEKKKGKGGDNPKMPKGDGQGAPGGNGPAGGKAFPGGGNGGPGGKAFPGAQAAPPVNPGANATAQKDSGGSAPGAPQNPVNPGKEQKGLEASQ